MSTMTPRMASTGTGMAATAGLVLLAAAAGYLAVHDLVLAVALVALPLLTLLVVRRRALVIVLAAVLPYTNDVSGGATGFNLAPSDLIMTVIVAGLVAEWLVTREAPELRPLRPLLIVLSTYVALLLVLLVFHLSLGSAIKTGQRLDLFLFPLIIGAAVVRWGDEVRFLSVYVICTSVFGVAWYFLNDTYELGQKNPVGGFIANAVILLITVHAVRRRWWVCAFALIPMLFLTQSRGAIISVGVAAVAYLMMQTGLNRVRSLIAMVPLAALTVVAFRLLPEDVQTRNTTFTSGTGTRAEWALRIRDQYHADAWQIIHDHPWTGLGVGRYMAGDQLSGTATTDPHQVLLQQAAEGGYLLAAGFLLLVVGSAVVLWRLTRQTTLGPAAVAVHLAIFSHGLVDVYWVRGTPVLGWLLVGMALAQAFSQRTRPEETRPEEGGLEQPGRVGRVPVGIA